MPLKCERRRAATPEPKEVEKDVPVELLYPPVILVVGIALPLATSSTLKHCHESIDKKEYQDT